MSKPELIKSSGQFFIAGAFAFITLFFLVDPITIPGSVVSGILLAVAMSRLRTGYSESIGRFASNFLLLGVRGPVLSVVGFVFMAVMGETAIEQGLWVLVFSGPAISLLGLTLFGLTALHSKPMPRLNWLPLFAGFWYPVTYVIFSVYDISQKGVFPKQSLPELIAMVVIQFLALCILGAVLISDSSKELATA